MKKNSMKRILLATVLSIIVTRTKGGLTSLMVHNENGKLPLGTIYKPQGDVFIVGFDSTKKTWVFDGSSYSFIRNNPTTEYTMTSAMMDISGTNFYLTGQIRSVVKNDYLSETEKTEFVVNTAALLLSYIEFTHNSIYLFGGNAEIVIKYDIAGDSELGSIEPWGKPFSMITLPGTKTVIIASSTGHTGMTIIDSTDMSLITQIFD